MSDTEVLVQIEVGPTFYHEIRDEFLENFYGNEIAGDLARTVCALQEAGYSQTYLIDGVNSIPDDFGQNEYYKIVSLRLEPETRRKIDCSNPYEVNMSAVSDEWTMWE